MPPSQERHDLEAVRGLASGLGPQSVLVLTALEHAEVATCAQARPMWGPAMLLSLDEGLDYLLERRGVEFVALRALRPPGAYADIEREAERLGQEWSVLGGEDITLFEGVSYASLVQWEMTLLFARIMKSVVDAQAVVAARLGDKFLAPIRGGCDPMVRYRGCEVMGDPAELLFANALAQVGRGHLRVASPTLPSDAGLGRNRVRWRARLSQTIQRWLLWPLIRRTLGIRIYLEDEYYLGAALVEALAGDRRYRMVRDATGGLGDCWRALRAHGPLHVPHTWFGRGVARRARRRAAAEFAKRWTGMAEALASGPLRFRGVDLWPLLRRKLEFLFRQKLPELAAEQAQIRAWLRATGIAASLLVEEVMRWSRQLIAAGRPLGMISLCVQHGLAGWEDIGPRHAFVPVAADLTAVWGEITRRWMERAGAPREHLVVVGAPRFDRYPRASQPAVPRREREAFCARAGIAVGRRLILYAETPAQAYLTPDFDHTFGTARRNLEIALAAMDRLTNFHLGIRLRYGEGDPYAALYRDVVDRTRVTNASFLPPLPLDEVLSYAEFTIVASSGVGLEALYYDHPIIVIDSTGHHRFMQIAEYGAGVLVDSSEDFVRFVRRYEADRGLRERLRHAQERLLRDQLTWRDGGASRRVIELLECLLDRGPVATRAMMASARPAPSSGGARRAARSSEEHE